MKFDYNGQKICVAQYMHDIYGKDVSDLRQPLLVVKHEEQMIHLPPEFCRIDGVPDSIRASPAMRDCLAACRVNPEQKMREIGDAMKLLGKQPVFREWNLKIEAQPVNLSQQPILPEPQAFKQNELIRINESVLRQLPI